MFRYFFIVALLFVRSNPVLGQGEQYLSCSGPVRPGNNFSLGADLHISKKALGPSVLVQWEGAKNRFYYASFGSLSNLDTLSFNTDNWFTVQPEFGMGHQSQYGKFYLMGGGFAGNQYFKYEYFDSNKQKQYFSHTRLFGGYFIGFTFKHETFEIGASAKIYGYYNYQTTQNLQYLRSNSESEIAATKIAKKNLLIEPQIFVSSNTGSYGSIRLAVRSTLVRNQYNQFPVSQPCTYSAGWFFDINDQ